MAMAKAIQGNLGDKPLAELIRELGEASVSGALRLTRDRAKAVIYFENGVPIYAASNIRAHRLADFLKRTGIANDETLAQASPEAKDEELLNLLVTQHKVRAAEIANIRANQVAEILRATLLWTEGDWQLDARVRLAPELRVTIDAQRLLLESTRHLPAAYVASRFPDPDERLEAARSNGSSAKLLPVEAFVASRLTDVMTVAELQTVSALGEEETLRAVYTLAISGAVSRGRWTTLQSKIQRPQPPPMVSPETESESIEDFIAQVEKAPDHYQMLGIGKHAETGQIKTAYHALARRYHPDLYHQADAALRTRIESAFARIARAYETLTDAAARATYDVQLSARDATSRVSALPSPPQPTQPATAQTAEARAAASFQKGVTALKQNQTQQALRFLAEAASLGAGCARYRAEYGRALINDPQTRRLAEFELKAAITLEPGNASYRVMLAELYNVLGLRRRAEGELQRALMADPTCESARALLAGLKK